MEKAPPPPTHSHMASFLRFLAANFSFTQLVTWAKPLYRVSRIACFSLRLQRPILAAHSKPEAAFLP